MFREHTPCLHFNALHSGIFGSIRYTLSVFTVLLHKKFFVLLNYIAHNEMRSIIFFEYDG